MWNGSATSLVENFHFYQCPDHCAEPQGEHLLSAGGGVHSPSIQSTCKLHFVSTSFTKFCPSCVDFIYKISTF